MKLAALALVALLLAPMAMAARAPLPYPDPLRGVAAKLVLRVAPLAAQSANASWWPDASVWFDRAQADADAGRFHAALFDAETLVEIVDAHQLQEQANASAVTTGDQRAFVTNKVLAWRAASNDTWLAFRAKLHATDGQVRSVQALEMTLFAADLAAGAKAGDAKFEAYLSQFGHEAAIPFDYLLVFARITQTVAFDVQAAGDVIDAGLALDGVPPILVADRWTNTTRVAMVDPGPVGPNLDVYETLAKPARANNETTLAVAILVLEQAAQRFNEMSTIFGDAKGRVTTVFTDADRSFQKQLNNTTADGARSRGLLGAFATDAVDKGVYTQAVVDNGTIDMGIVLGAWSGLDHAKYADSVLMAASPVKPVQKNTPTPGFGVGVGGCLLALLLFRRRR